MTNIHDQEIAILKSRIEKLEQLLALEVVRLDKRITESDEGAVYYIEKHGEEHLRLMDMIYPAYCKTHPGYIETLVEAEKITGKTSGDGSDPQP